MKIYLLNICKIKESEIERLKTAFPLRMKEAESFRNRDDFLRKTGSTLLLSLVFPELSEKELRYNEHGKPHIEGAEFCISHSGNFVCLVKDDKPVGLDIELENEKNLRVIKRVLTDREAEYVALDSSKFHLIWTRKESCFKMIGTGIGAGVKSIDVMDTDCHFFSFKFENCFISICSENEIKSIEIEEVN